MKASAIVETPTPPEDGLFVSLMHREVVLTDAFRFQRSKEALHRRLVEVVVLAAPMSMLMGCRQAVAL